jgi:DNA-binding MarR family transcriptional regulator
MSINSALDAYARLRRTVAQLASQELRKLAIGPKQMSILHYLHENGEATAGGLARFTCSDVAAVSRALKALEKAGLVEKSVDQADNRRAVLRLSRQGRLKAEKADAVRSNIGRKLIRDMSRREQSEFVRLLNKAAESARGGMEN